MAKSKWTPQAVAALKAMWPDTRAREITATLGISERPVYRKARELGLQRSPEFVERVRALAMHHIRTHPKVLARQKSKGQVPWNKGIPGSTGTQAGCRTTQFRPGNTPPHPETGSPIANMVGNSVPSSSKSLHRPP